MSLFTTIEQLHAYLIKFLRLCEKFYAKIFMRKKISKRRKQAKQNF